MTLEDAIEQAFWEFDAERKRTGAERDAFKRQLRAFTEAARRPCSMCDNGDGHLKHPCPRVVVFPAGGA